MISRDSWILVLTILAGVLGVILAQVDLLPASWQQYKGLITILLSVVTTIAAILRQSPLAASTTPTRDATTALGGMFRVYDKKE